MHDEDQKRVQDLGDGRGFDGRYKTWGDHGNRLEQSEKIILSRRNYIELTVRPAVFPRPLDRFAAALAIPALRAGERPIWSPVEGAHPEDVLAQLAAADEPVPATPLPPLETRRMTLAAFEAEYGPADS